jgi:hypothetical protein
LLMARSIPSWPSFGSCLEDDLIPSDADTLPFG